MAFKITSVRHASAAGRAGIKAGEYLEAIDGKKVRDVLDYRFYTAERHIVLTIIDEEGNSRDVKVINRSRGDIGLDFETYLMDKPQRCHNKCIFCFIDQMPKGMRESLYFKDDDTRLSFLTGNYVTFTNVSDDDITRIIEQRISPINISVHTTNLELRKTMLKNKNADNVLKYMKRICDAELPMNAQLVLCPNINDGEELKRSLRDLKAFYPALRSVSAVPVGLTKFREGLYPLEAFDKERSAQTIDIIEAFQEECLKDLGTRMFFAADEFYLKAERPIPGAEVYEDFPQIENGVGMMASLKDEFYSALEYSEGMKSKSGKYTLICGSDIFLFMSSLVDEITKRWHNLSVEVVKIENDFFGRSITVSGLICGCDIVKQLSGRDLGQGVVFTKNMLRSGTNIFLDDMTTDEISQKLGVPLYPLETDGDSLLDFFMEEEY